MTILSDAQLDLLLSKVRRPSRYIGREINSYNKQWDSVDVRWCLAFPDVYEIGMSHIGLAIIYDILNKEEGVLADRVFAPWVDMERAMREEKISLWGLESRRSISEFDVVGITLPYELTYTNILTILDLAGIPFLAKERDGRYPLIIGGGVSAFNPEPVADFFDAIVIGDGEGAVIEISRLLKEERRVKRDVFLHRLAGIRGVYVPIHSGQSPVSDYGPSSGRHGLIVNKAVVPDINSSVHPASPVVPYMRVVHDRVGVEIQRGCTRGCRFCQAGYIYRPLRQRRPEKIMELCDEGLRATGNEDLSFLSLSAGDHECLPEILAVTAKRHETDWINISLPSLRVETLTKDVLNVLKRALHGGFTIAPEAATERLRRVINKGNTESELFETIEKVFSMGWRQLKLYFMVGLPTETVGDVLAIADVAHKALDIGKRYRRDVTITVSISTFVPKPHTPFQWARQLTIEETKEKQRILRDRMRRRGLEVKFHDAKVSFLEGVFSRGDRRLAEAIVLAWKKGSRFDGWDEEIKFDLWEEAFSSLNIEPAEYLKERSFGEELPWGHIFPELSNEFLKREYQLAIMGDVTPDCSRGKCSGCGVCDFEIVKNRTAGKSDIKYPSPTFVPASRHTYVLDFTFTKLGPSKWLSHLELMMVLRRAFRRAGLSVKYTQGFHPHMRLSLERALKVGEASECERGRIELYSDEGIEEKLKRLVLPEGIKLIGYSIG